VSASGIVVSGISLRAKLFGSTVSGAS
jgi:hypothetical protein